MSESSSDDLDFLLGPDEDPLGKLLAHHLRLSDELENTIAELAAENDKTTSLTKSYNEILTQNEKLIALVDGNVASAELRSKGDHENQPEQRKRPGNHLATGPPSRLTFQALRVHEAHLAHQPKGMPVPSQVFPKTSNRIEIQIPPPSEARRPVRQKTGLCNCFSGKCTTNPHCVCNIRNEPCSSRCHMLNKGGVDTMIYTCTRLDRSSLGWTSWTNGGSYILDKPHAPKKSDKTPQSSPKNLAISTSTLEMQQSASPTIKHNVSKAFPEGRKKAYSCNCWFGDCSTNPKCWCRKYGEPCHPSLCHSGTLQSSSQLRMTQSCARLDYQTENMQEWQKGGVYIRAASTNKIMKKPTVDQSSFRTSLNSPLQSSTSGNA